MKKIIDRSLSDGKNLERVATVVERLTRRQVKQTAAIITPYPISSCTQGEDVRGEILKYMFCASGSIDKGLVTLAKRPKDAVEIKITIENDLGKESKSYMITNKSLLSEPRLAVYSGDRLTISIFPTGPEDKLTEVWVAFMWTPSVKDASIKNFLIDELEKESNLEEL